ncbi:hypothetical protein [Frigoriflavimonas asaccharolytica]|uniref:Uncharacterized protein n=1 Tax=Frigoriflavimonas asaccharolytica TaxID=2735899 RepID=A0A8J8K923_9FLAO|nr:hypothetical protein [Frigoriflavimonas asaccharolytica]NRS93151.1 hypothetical protein [Frigoriflavimonas asaccharolytica]
MSWEREPLFTKAKLYFERAYDEDKEEPYFGLWCAMGLELLARSAVSFVSPTLLAEPERDHQNLLHALGLGSAKAPRKSIATINVFSLCQNLITDFTEANFKIASAIINRRNEEVHSGSAAFEEYPTQQWIAGFYRCCQILCTFQGESLNSLFGDDIEKEADLILTEVEESVIGKTKSLIAAHSKVYEGKEAEKKEELKESSEKNGDRLSYRGYHRVECPSCKCVATVFGEPYGKQNVENNEDEIIVRQSILPTKFICTACELKLNGYSSLKSAGIGNHYTRRNKYSPEEYYDMINPDDSDTITERYNELNPPEDYGWSNE